jgi:NADPH:quinone reductase-like Zn-dependent oxidoreductase
VIAAVNPVRPEGGAQAQHIVVPAASVVPVPEGVSLAQASILLMTGLTALNALQIAALKKGQILAVSGGAGLLAQYAIAAAKRQGIKVIADANPADAQLVAATAPISWSSADPVSPRRSAGSCPMASTRCSIPRP